MDPDNEETVVVEVPDRKDLRTPMAALCAGPLSDSGMELTREATMNRHNSVTAPPVFNKIQHAVRRDIQRKRVVKVFGGDTTAFPVKRRPTILGDPRNWFERISIETIDFWVYSISMLLHIANLTIVPFRAFITQEEDAPFSSTSCAYFEFFLDAAQLAVMCFKVFRPYEFQGVRIQETSLTSRQYFETELMMDAFIGVPTSILSWGLLQGNPLPRLNKLMIIGIFHDARMVAESPTTWQLFSPYMANTLVHLLTGFFIVHAFSCSWVLILRADSNCTADCLGAFIAPNSIIEGASSWELYLKGFEWTLKHMAGFGVVAGFPQTDHQTVFMLAVAICGLSLFTTTIASVGSFVMHISSVDPKDRLRVKLDEVNAVLDRQKLPPEFCSEVRGYYRHVFKVSGHVGISSILDDLPASLYTRVNHEVGKSILDRMPLFKGIEHNEVVDRLVGMLTPKVFLPGLEIVSVGQNCSEMIILWSGELKVMSAGGHTLQILQPGESYGEVALLAKVKRLTSVVTTQFSTVFVLTRKDFQASIEEFPELIEHVKGFRSAMVELRRSGCPLPESSTLRDMKLASMRSLNGQSGTATRRSSYAPSSGMTPPHTPRRRQTLSSTGPLTPRRASLTEPHAPIRRFSESAALPVPPQLPPPPPPLLIPAASVETFDHRVPKRLSEATKHFGDGSDLQSDTSSMEGTNGEKNEFMKSYSGETVGAFLFAPATGLSSRSSVSSIGSLSSKGSVGMSPRGSFGSINTMASSRRNKKPPDVKPQPGNLGANIATSMRRDPVKERDRLRRAMSSFHKERPDVAGDSGNSKFAPVTDFEPQEVETVSSQPDSYAQEMDDLIDTTDDSEPPTPRFLRHLSSSLSPNAAESSIKIKSKGP